MVKDFIAKLLRPRDPKPGEIWWVRDEDLGISHGDHHPVLVVSGTRFQGGPARIAIGSSTRVPLPTDFVVDPEDCEWTSGLDKRTRFRLEEARRIPRDWLRQQIASLGEEKRKALLKVRSRAI